MIRYIEREKYDNNLKKLTNKAKSFLKNKYHTFIFESDYNINNFNKSLISIIEKEFDFRDFNIDKAFCKCLIIIEKEFLREMTKFNRDNLDIYHRIYI